MAFQTLDECKLVQDIIQTHEIISFLCNGSHVVLCALGNVFVGVLDLIFTMLCSSADDRIPVFLCLKLF